MLKRYLTVNENGSNELNIQKSRFIGDSRRAETEEDAIAFIDEIKKKHHDATHNCSAYMIGEHDNIQKANDDGEPSGTAGVPMLEVLKKQQLKDTVVVVTRYFGGIKLGAGGLIRAYGKATSQAIQATGVVERILTDGFSITVDYTLLGMLENEIRQSPHILHAINYADDVEFIVYVETDESTAFKEWIVNLTSDNASIQPLDQKYIEKEVPSSH